MARNRDPEDDAPKLPLEDDVTRAIHLLEWARKRGFRVGPVLQVGDVKMQISDVRQVKMEGLDPERVTDLGPYGEFGLDDKDEPAPGTAG